MRYIDSDALIKKLFPYDVVDKKDYTINAKAVADAIAKIPTADVVPKSEVEVARKIFEEIEKYWIKSDTLPDCARLVDLDKIAELKKKYTEEKHEKV